MKSVRLFGFMLVVCLSGQAFGMKRKPQCDKLLEFLNAENEDDKKTCLFGSFSKSGLLRFDNDFIKTVEQAANLLDFLKNSVENKGERVLWCYGNGYLTVLGIAVLKGDVQSVRYILSLSESLKKVLIDIYFACFAGSARYFPALVHALFKCDLELAKTLVKEGGAKVDLKYLNKILCGCSKNQGNGTAMKVLFCFGRFKEWYEVAAKLKQRPKKYVDCKIVCNEDED